MMATEITIPPEGIDSVDPTDDSIIVDGVRYEPRDTYGRLYYSPTFRIYLTVTDPED